MTTLHEDLYAFLLVKWLNMYWSKEYWKQKNETYFFILSTLLPQVLQFSGKLQKLDTMHTFLNLYAQQSSWFQVTFET
jgi:hypothetical protein